MAVRKDSLMDTFFITLYYNFLSLVKLKIIIYNIYIYIIQNSALQWQKKSCAKRYRRFSLFVGTYNIKREMHKALNFILSQIPFKIKMHHFQTIHDSG